VVKLIVKMVFSNHDSMYKFKISPLFTAKTPRIFPLLPKALLGRKGEKGMADFK
jgi:hypothetical protein